MSLRDAKRVLQWQVVSDALVEAGVDAETVALVEHARAIDDTVHATAQTLLGLADAKQAKNYVKVELVGLVPPFERAYVELVRPDGKTSHELREMLRDRLMHVRKIVEPGDLDHRDCVTIVNGIDQDLQKEAP